MKVLLFKGGDPISWLVCLQTRSPYSHAALLDTCGCCAVESFPGPGVRRRRLTKEDWSRIDVFDVRGMSPDQWKIALDFALSQLRKKYDWRSVFRFLDKLPASNNDRWFCSELVHGALAEAGVRVLERIPSAEVSPALLAVSPMLVPDPYFDPENLNLP